MDEQDIEKGTRGLAVSHLGEKLTSAIGESLPKILVKVAKKESPYRNGILLACLPRRRAAVSCDRVVGSIDPDSLCPSMGTLRAPKDRGS